MINAFTINLNEVKKIWLNQFPIQELPDEYVQLVATSCRKGNSGEVGAFAALNKYEPMVKEWFENQLEINRMMQDAE